MRSPAHQMWEAWRQESSGEHQPVGRGTASCTQRTSWCHLGGFISAALGVTLWKLDYGTIQPYLSKCNMNIAWVQQANCKGFILQIYSQIHTKSRKRLYYSSICDYIIGE